MAYDDIFDKDRWIRKSTDKSGNKIRTINKMHTKEFLLDATQTLSLILAMSRNLSSGFIAAPSLLLVYTVELDNPIGMDFNFTM
jgi:hypothetical protein